AEGTPIARYTTTQTGGSVVIDHPFNRVFVFSYGIDSRDQTLDLNEGTDLSDAQKEKEGLEEGRIDSFSLGIAKDTRLNKFDAFQGSRSALNYSQGFSLLGADFSYSRYILDLRKYVPLNARNRWVLAGRLKFGDATGSVPATEQFYIGGTDTVRGYEFGRLRGFKMGLFNLELRLRTNPVGGVLFFDAGDAGPNFATDDKGNLVKEKFKIENTVLGVGAGIRFKVPQLSNLPIRLDFGYNLERGGVRFHFGFGQLF
ncbi:MAG: BamA/TamA family outer membrane protein, partial [bacterium]